MSEQEKVFPMRKMRTRLGQLPFAADAAEGGLWSSAHGSNTPPPQSLAACAEGLGEAACAWPRRERWTACLAATLLLSGLASSGHELLSFDFTFGSPDTALFRPERD